MGTATQGGRLEQGAPWGRYSILEALGEGSMGVVYAAHDARLDRRVALKLLQRDPATPEARARLLREARAMARLSHPNVVAVYDADEFQGEVYLAMELVEGKTLREWIAGRRRHEVLAAFVEAGRGLAAAHAVGVVHRDFKPANVLVDKSGRVRVTDFSLARSEDREQPATAAAAEPGKIETTLTRTGALVGTPAYMSPEQLARRPIDHRTDQFSFCVALYEALYGERPFAGETIEALAFAVSMGKVRPPRRDARVPQRLRRVLLRGLSADPSDRFPDMDALLRALERHRTIVQRWRVAAGAAILAILVGAAVHWRPARPPARDAIDRSVAVLPFATSGSGREESLYASVFHDQLIRQLSRIADLQVITRTSVLPYRSGSTSLAEVRDALGVSSVVEGSISSDGTRLHVETRLLDARAGGQLWSGAYDRDVADQFEIHRAIVEGVAGALKAWVTPLELLQLARRPTRNAEAYDLYLRALEYGNQPDNQATLEPIMERLCRKATELDPKFALAHVCLSHALSNMYWWVNGTPESVAAEAKAAAEEALRLQPDLADAHFALGMYYYWGRRDYENALREFELSRGSVSGTPWLDLFWSSAVLRRQGHFEEAIRREEKVVRLDPRTPWVTKEFGLSLAYLRRYEEADRVLDRALALEPALTSAALLKAFVREAWKGDNEYAKKVLADVRGNIESGGRVGGWDFLGDVVQHNPREGLALLDSLKAPWIITFDAAFPKAFLAAVAHESLGDAALARKEYEDAVPLIEARVDDRPGNARERVLLAQAYAALGRKTDALREAARAVDTLPASKDALLGADIAVDRALVEARVGATDSAIEHVRQLLAIPSMLSPAMLRLDPRWAPLRRDPRFQQLAGIDSAQAQLAQP